MRIARRHAPVSRHRLRVAARSVAPLVIFATLLRCGNDPVVPDAVPDAGEASNVDASSGVPDAATEAQVAVEAGNGCLRPSMLCSAKPLYQSKIGVWYTLWWMPGDTGHWQQWSRYQPLAGFYRSGQAAAFASHLAQMEGMSIDFLLLDHTNGIGNDGGNMAKNGEALVATLETTKSSVHQAVANGGALWMGASPNRAGQQQEDDYVVMHHAGPTHTSRFLSHELPLLVVYTGPGQADDFTDARFTIGVATGTVSGASAIMKTRGLFGWVYDEPTPIDKRVMGVMPGWSTAHLGRATTPIAREGGALFRREWLRVIKANPEIIMINSWNDYAEETAIEPATRRAAGAELWSDSYGTECPAFYAEMARGYSLLRWGLEIDTFVREETDERVYTSRSSRSSERWRVWSAVTGATSSQDGSSSSARSALASSAWARRCLSTSGPASSLHDPRKAS